MHEEEDLWWAEDAPSFGTSDLFRMMPEIREYVESASTEPGMRSILERPDVLSKAWHRSEPRPKRRVRVRRRRARALRAHKPRRRA